MEADLVGGDVPERARFVRVYLGVLADPADPELGTDAPLGQMPGRRLVMVFRHEP